MYTCNGFWCFQYTDPVGSESPDVVTLQYDTVDDVETAGAADTSSQSQLSALELENRLLKNEVQSLNGEMNSVIRRAKDAQDGRLQLCLLPTTAAI